MSSDDPYGQLLLDLIEGKESFEVVERDDGFVYASREQSDCCGAAGALRVSERE